MGEQRKVDSHGCGYSHRHFHAECVYDGDEQGSGEKDKERINA